jgi:hypothetical protein
MRGTTKNPSLVSLSSIHRLMIIDLILDHYIVNWRSRASISTNRFHIDMLCFGVCRAGAIEDEKVEASSHWL